MIRSSCNVPVVVLAALLVSLAACSSPTEPQIQRPPDAVEMEPLARWAQWYDDVERCSGLEGDFERVRWFKVPGGLDWESRYNGKDVAGEWWPDHDIYIAEGRIGHPTEATVVLHEIGHELLGSYDHLDPPFGGCVPRKL